MTRYALRANFVQLLLMRIGVGVGEAGSNPPSHSMISDLYRLRIGPPQWPFSVPA